MKASLTAIETAGLKVKRRNSKIVDRRGQLMDNVLEIVSMEFLWTVRETSHVSPMMVDWRGRQMG